MKILIVSAFPPDPAPEANHAYHLSEQLARAGHSIHVLCKNGGIAGTHPEITVHPLMRSWGWGDLPRVARCLRQCRPDVVLLLYIGWVYHHKPMITFLPTLCRMVLPGVPCITQFENIDELRPRRSAVARALRSVAAGLAGLRDVHLLFGTLLRDSARIITLSSPHRDRLAPHHPQVLEKNTILPPPPLIRLCADPPQIARRRMRESWGVADDEIVLLYWGYIYPGKGIETLLRAFRVAAARVPKLRLVLAGGLLEFPTEPISCVDYFRLVHRLPQELGIAGRVTWTGPFEWDSDVGSRYLHAADVCVLPFDYGVTLNNSSLAAASTHGLPVISTELPTGKDEALEHRRNIFLCPPRDFVALAEAIELVCTDARLRERLRAGITRLARDWHSWDTLAERLTALMCAAVRAREVPEPGLRLVESAQTKLSTHALDDEEQSGAVKRPAESEEDAINAPLVSVIVAVYNVGQYLAQCLDALVNQTLKNIEILVVNDASTDNSLEIIEAYQARYANIRVFNCPRNRGLASVRNVGLRAARGRYVAFADGDDWVDVRMCEMMYRRASEDDADVLIADTFVLYDDTKDFGHFFDWRLRQSFDPQLLDMPFSLEHERRVLLIEPVAWTKMYKRAFLRRHGFFFEEGMNSYEDICFHFSVLLKAQRISMIDDALMYYRQNRPGQISGRTSRKVFEVFDVFRRVQDNLAAWSAPTEIWALLIRVQLRQFDWLLRDRVRSHYKKEFFAEIGRQMQNIPEAAFRLFARDADPIEAIKLKCMRRNRLRTYECIADRRWPWFPVLCLALHDDRRGALRRSRQRYLGKLRWRLGALAKLWANKVLDIEGIRMRVCEIQSALGQLNAASWNEETRNETFVAEAFRIHGQLLFFSHPTGKAGLSDAVWRVEHDFYLSRAAVLREGDVVVDVGAHVGVFAIHLAKKYPFVTVYAVEPDPVNFACLERNVRLNGTTNVVPINAAIAGEEGAKPLYCSPWNSGWATLDRKIAADNHFLRVARVQATTLDRLFREHRIAYCRLLKITALGAVDDSLRQLAAGNCIDHICGEVESTDGNRVRLEAASWRVARQHFWRIAVRRPDGIRHSWIQRLPEGIEPLPMDRQAGAVVRMRPTAGSARG